MSLRDDLDFIDKTTWRVRDPGEWRVVLERLRAALTPAAEKWLEALPVLLGLEADATPGEWEWVRISGTLYLKGDTDGCVGENCVGEIWGMHDGKLVEALRNALHAAASAVNAGTDNKEQK